MSQNDCGQSEKRAPEELSDEELLALYHACDGRHRWLISRFVKSAANMTRLAASNVIKFSAYKRDPPND